jgi:AraC-like DNA-binding protein
MISCGKIDLPRKNEEGIHTQPANEFFLTVKGKGIHRTVHGDQPFKKGDIHFFPRGQLHTHIKGTKICNGLTVRFRDEAFSDTDPADKEAHQTLAMLKIAAYQGQNKVSLSPRTHKEVCSLFNQAVNEKRPAKSFWKGIGLLALSFIDKGIYKQRRMKDIDPRIVNILCYFDTNAAQKISINDLTKYACLSKSHFHHLFKKETGTSVIDYLSQIRIGMAVLKLASTDQTILEIAHSCGFNSASRFYEAFKKYRGHEPGDLRKK